jgi:hypothetical protein
MLPDDPDELTEQLQAIAGSDPDIGTQFYIDGFSGGRLPPKSAIREIRMNQNPYSAQYDQVGFGRIEIFTKPGADTWHADLFTEINDSSFNSHNPFVTTQPPYHSLELWGDLNGPVTKHSSQFTELWRESSSDDSIVNAFVLDSSLNPASFTQVFPNSSANTDFSTRYDWELGKIQTLSLRYHLNLTDQTNAGVGQFALASQAYDSNNTEQVLQFSDSQTYGVKLLNETRFQYIRDRNRQTPQTFGPPSSSRADSPAAAATSASTTTPRTTTSCRTTSRPATANTPSTSALASVPCAIPTTPPRISTASTLSPR